MRSALASPVLIAILAACLAGGGALQCHAQQAPQGERVDLVASDGVRTAAFWYDCGEPAAPAALLLHDNGRDHFVWNPLIVQLQHAGISVLALDLRGHGASDKLAPEKHQLLLNHDTAVYREMLLDAQAGVAFLQREKHIPPAKVAVVGADLGSSIGFALMAANAKLQCMIALSPALHGYGFDTEAQVKQMGKRPLLLLTTKSQYPEATEAIAKQLTETGAVQVAFCPGRDTRGTAMLGQRPFVEHNMRNFLSAAFGIKP
jgi:pimeloyl-ACP methyl ester carboxylesterase